MRSRRRFVVISNGGLCAPFVLPLILPSPFNAADRESEERPMVVTSSSDVLTAEQWQRVDSAVDRGLAYLAPSTHNSSPVRVMRWLGHFQQPDGEAVVPTA